MSDDAGVPPGAPADDTGVPPGDAGVPPGGAGVPPDEPAVPRRGARVARAARARTRRRRRLVVLGLALVVLLPVVVVGGWLWWQLDPPGGTGKTVEVEIARGWGVARIGDELAKRGVIGSSFVFQAWTRVEGAGPYQAGTYRLHRDDGVKAAVRMLDRGPVHDYRRLALVPGLTLDMIADRVGTVPGLSRDRFLEVARSGVVRSKFQPAGVSSLEGLTWPDTYYVAKGENEETVLRRIVQAFDEHATDAGLPAGGRGGQTPYEALIVASLVQGEAKLDEDRPLIAAVVDNRLGDGMPLQIDATLLYARGERRGAITQADYDSPSPYNTYRLKGLPPTPIMTVTTASIQAALQPANVPYRYYVLIDRNGKHAFATTFAEHERNVAEARSKGLIG